MICLFLLQKIFGKDKKFRRTNPKNKGANPMSNLAKGVERILNKYSISQYLSSEENELETMTLHQATQAILALIAEDVIKIRDEIQAEIDSRPQYSNIGKKGCVKRLTDLTQRLGKEG
jgi:hypothetical protein